MTAPSDEISRLRRELETAFDVAREIGEERNELAAALGREVAMTQRLKAVLKEAQLFAWSHMHDRCTTTYDASDPYCGHHRDRESCIEAQEMYAKISAALASDNGGGSDGTR